MDAPRSPQAPPRAALMLASWLLTAGMIVGLPATACAHVPGVEPESHAAAPLEIGGPDVSRAFYGYLAPGERSDVYRFEVAEAVTRTVGIIVPAYREHEHFRPTLVIESEGETVATIEDPGIDPRQAMFEPFSLTSFWTGGEQEVAFEPNRRYTLRVEPDGDSGSVEAGPDARSGRYVIVFGGPERFGGEEIADTFKDLPKIWFGSYGGAPLRLSTWPTLLVGVILAGIVALIVFAGRAIARRVATRRL